MPKCRFCDKVLSHHDPLLECRVCAMAYAVLYDLAACRPDSYHAIVARIMFDLEDAKTRLANSV